MAVRFLSGVPKTTRLQLLLAVVLLLGVFAFRFGSIPALAEEDGGTVWTWAPLSSPALAQMITAKAGYWMIAATFALFVAVLAREVCLRRPSWGELARAHWPGLAVALAGAVFWQVHEPHGFKVLFDEHILGGTAYNMHFERSASFPSSAHFANGRMYTLYDVVDKRPLLYPFLVSAVHDGTGYRAANSWVVNGVLGGVLLLLVYAAGAAMGGWRIGCLGQWLLIGLPLLPQNATGGGFDLLNVTLLAAVLLAAFQYWRQPGAGGLDLYACTTALLANTRYESLLYFAALGTVVLLKWIRERSVTFSWVAACVPLLALSPLLVNQVFLGSAGNFQTTEENFLHVRHLPDNLEHAVHFLFSWGETMSNSLLLSGLGVLALLFFLVGSGRRVGGWWRERAWGVPLLVLVGFVLLNTLLAMNLNWGAWDDPMVSRFSLPLQLAFTWCVMAVAVWLLGARTLPGWVLAVVAACAVVFSAPTSSRAEITLNQGSYVPFGWAIQYVKEHADRGVLVVCRSTVGFILEQQPAITLARVNFGKHPERLAEVVDLGLYREVWVVQEYEINRRLNTWVERHDDFADARLDNRFVLAPVAEFAYAPTRKMRISKVVAFDPARPAGVTVLAGRPPRLMNRDHPAGYPLHVLSERPAELPPALPTEMATPPSRDEAERLLLERLP